MIFGKMIARTHSIEFQKRGLPHMHILFWLEEGSHMTPKELDQFICTELPDKYLRDKDHTGKLMVDGEGKPIHKWDENDKELGLQLHLSCCMDPVDSTILLLAVWLMCTVNLDIPRTTKQQHKYWRMVILSITNVMILTKCTKHSVMASPMTTQIVMWCHTTSTSSTSMIATSM